MQGTSYATDGLASKLKTWLLQLKALLEASHDVKCYRLGLSVTTSAKPDHDIYISEPTDRVPASEIPRTRDEAARLNRIAISHIKTLGAAEDTSQNICIVAPLPSILTVTEGWIEVEARVSSERLIRLIIDDITQAMGWVLFHIEHEKREADQEDRDRSFRALEAIVSLSSSQSFSDASRALVSELASRFECDRVSLGLLSRNKIKIEAISHTSRFSRSSVVSRLLRSAMEEAIDQNSVIGWPENTPETFINQQQSELVEYDESKSVLTVPLFDGEICRGALTFERYKNRGFSNEDIHTVEALAGILTPLLIDKRDADRWLIVHAFFSLVNLLKKLFGKRHFIAKVVVFSILLLGLALTFIERPQYVLAQATVEGREIRTMSPAFDGVILSANVTQGEQVRKGDLLFSLDDREFALERTRLLAQKRQAELELDRSLSSRDRTETALINARLEQIESQLSLVDEQIERSAVRAPFDALVVSGDLTKSIGVAVSRGEPLMTLSPLSEYDVQLDVEEKDLRIVTEGMEGSLTLSALPSQTFSIEVTNLVPFARYQEGTTLFSVEAQLTDEDTPLLHGMTGSSRLTVGTQPLYVLWGMPIYNEARLWAWRNLAL